MTYAAVTPCPLRQEASVTNKADWNDELTANIDYTTAFQASFQHVKPKRVGPQRRRNAPIVIHEDAEQIEAADGHISKQPGRQYVPQSRLAQPAKRAPTAIRQRCGIIDVPVLKTQDYQQELCPLPHEKISSSAEKHVQITRKSYAKAEKAQSSAHVDIQRPVRRQTLYVPSEDTAQPSMWMGLFCPITQEVVAQGSQAEDDLTGVAAKMAEKRRRMTSTVERPRRMPLKQNLMTQAKMGEPDRAGAPTGKENVPPSQQTSSDGNGPRPKPINKSTLLAERDAERKRFLAQARLDNLSQSKSQQSAASEYVLYEVGTRQSTQSLKKAKNAARDAESTITDDSSKASIKTTPLGNSNRPSTKEHTRISLTIDETPEPVIDFTRNPGTHDSLPTIEEIHHPDSYEERWLRHQEAVLARLINSVFSNAHGSEAVAHHKIRAGLSAFYNVPEISLIRSRVQAAVHYGSLSLTHEGLLEIESLPKDVKRKHEFVQFWLDTFDHDLLALALEVVVGQRLTPASEKPWGPHKILSDHIGSFLLRHEEACFKPAGTGNVSNDLGHKTILKSLMVLKALSILKEQDLIGDKYLFLNTALVMSLAEAVRVLMKMLNRAASKPVRQLRYLGYEVNAEQQTTEDVELRVQNLAVDLRDGRVLTRLCEVFPNTSPAKEVNLINDENSKLELGTRETHPLNTRSKPGDSDRNSDASKTRLALDTISKIYPIGNLLENVNEEDITNGHREKTIYVLWILATQIGLPTLLDRKSLAAEINRLVPGLLQTNGLKDNMSQSDSEELLMMWIKAIAMSKGLHSDDDGTAVADGRLFQAVFDEYEPCMIAPTSDGHVSLNERLVRVGCSKQFSDLFAHHDQKSRIISRSYVITALAYFASRLLAPSKLCRNAIIIQRAWRKYRHFRQFSVTSAHK